MKVAVLTLTRDRLAYTQHCFAALREHAGCDYDHYVLDQASQDGTGDWLVEEYLDGWLDVVVREPGNVGICRGLNKLLDALLEPYDVLVRFDNDCEVVQPGTLRRVCEVAYAHDAIVAPRVLGLLHPPAALKVTALGDATLEETAILGGIFMAIPGTLFTTHGYRYDERMPPWTGDEAIVPWWRSQGGRAGYLDGWAVNHYETTAGQRARWPEYEERKMREMSRR